MSAGSSSDAMPVEQNMQQETRNHQSCPGAPGTGQNRSIRRISIVVGDLLFLAVIGAVSMAAMHMAHMTEWGFAVEMAIGMAVAMVAQLMLAWLAAPLLGSIETMVPSMLVAMIAPMAICALHGSGCVLTWWGALSMGAASGVLASLLLVAYGASCRRWASREGRNLGGSHQ